MDINEKKLEIEMLLNDHKLPQETVEAILNVVDNVKNSSIEAKEELTEEEIKIKIMETNDWRKKARLSAMLISRSLSN